MNMFYVWREDDLRFMTQDLNIVFDYIKKHSSDDRMLKKNIHYVITVVNELEV